MFTAKLAVVVLAAAFAAAFVSPAAGLSWPLCDQGGAVWVTEKPETDPTVRIMAPRRAVWVLGH